MFAPYASIFSLFASQEAPRGGLSDPGLLFIPLMFAIFFFVVYLPSRRDKKKHQEMLSGLMRGDEVVTNSGIIGTVADISDKVLTLEVARNVKIRVLRQMVAKKATDLADASEAKAPGNAPKSS
jgi:preprotein translocase subunit YajC